MTETVDPVLALLEEYLARRRAGEHPDITELAQGRLELADRLRALIPTLQLLEQASANDGKSHQLEFGEFSLSNEIGRGGMGVIYRAHDSAFGRDVAVKVLSDRFAADSTAAHRFLDEARITGQLQHPGIPAVHQVGTLPTGRPFMAMKLIKGQTLADLLQAQPETGRLLNIFETICQVMAYAHGQRVIHRDLKPANIMVGGFGEVQVMDWGLAKVLTSGAGKPALTPSPDETEGSFINSLHDTDILATQAGSLVGTPAYIAPEQAAGEFDRIDKRSDVFGLGAVLAVMLTGKPPYVGESPAAVRVLAIRGDLGECHARLSQCGAESGWVELCMRCLAFAPEDRFEDAEQVAQAAAALRIAAEERTHQAERATLAATVRAGEQQRKRRWQLAAAGAGLLLAAFAGFGIPYANSIRNDRRAAEAEGAFERGTRSANEGRIGDGIALMRQAIEQLPENRIVLRRYFQQSAARWETKLLRPIHTRTHTSLISAACVSPTGSDVIIGGKDGTVCLWSLADDSVRNFTSSLPLPRPYIESVAFDTTGKRCAAGGTDSHARIWDVETGGQLSECQLDGYFVMAVALLGRGDILVTGSGNKLKPICLWSVRSPIAEPLASPKKIMAGLVTTLIGSPDGESFIAMTTNGECWLYDKSGNLLHDIGNITGEPVATAAFSQSGATLTVGGAKLTVCDTQSGQVIRSMPLGPENSAKGLALQSDGSTSLAIERKGRTLMRQTTPELDSWEEFPIEGDGVSVDSTAADEILLLSGRKSTTLQLSKLPPVQRRSVKANGLTALGKVYASNHSSHLLTLARDTGNSRSSRRVEIHVWDRLSLRSLATFVGRPGPMFSISTAQCPMADSVVLGCHLDDDNKAAVMLGEPTAQGTFDVRPLGIHTSNVVSLVFSPDGKFLYSGCQQRKESATCELVRWDVASKTRTQMTSYPGTINVLAVSPNGRLLAVGGVNGYVTLLPSDTLVLANAPQAIGGTPITALAFSKDGRYLAFGTGGGRVVVCRNDHDGLTAVAQPQVPSGRVSAIRFSADSIAMLVGTEERDSGISVWNTAVWRQIGPPISVPGELLDFDLCVDQKTIAALTADGRLSTFPFQGFE